MIRYRWFFVIIFSVFLESGCSSATKMLRTSYTGEKKSVSTTISSTIASKDKSHKDSTIYHFADANKMVLSKVEIVEEYDTTGSIDTISWSYPIMRKTTTMFSLKDSRTSSHDYWHNNNESYVDTVSVVISSDNQSSESVMHSIDESKRQDRTKWGKMMTKLFLLSLILIVWLLYRLFKPYLNSVLTIFKNFLK